MQDRKFKLITPVAFVIFNKPDTAIKVFEQIRLAKPPKLLVIADGPRENKPGEVEKCQQCRDIIKNVDWDCEVLTNYSNVNLGCRERPASGFDWVFSNVDEAIILEDDCVPDQSFFQFSQELLERYRDDKRIMSISGTNVLSGIKKVSLNSNMQTYYYSNIAGNWGWATWKRAWDKYDITMKSWPYVKEKNILYDIFPLATAKFWENIFQSVYDGKLETAWDYQWYYSILINRGMCIMPNGNLVTNIGFGKCATNTFDESSVLSRLSIQPVSFPLKHPEIVYPDVQLDKKTNKEFFSIISFKRRLCQKLNNVSNRFTQILKLLG